MHFKPLIATNKLVIGNWSYIMLIHWNNFKHPYAQIYAPVIHIRLFCKTATKARTLGHSELEETQFIAVYILMIF